MKKLLILLCSLVAITGFAQVNFKLKADGSFQTPSGESYVVVPFQGKSAQEIFNLLQTNVLSIYRDASKVMNSVENTAIRIRGFAKSGEIFPFITIFEKSLEGYYDLAFKIRAGRVRVSAPFIEDEVVSVVSEKSQFLFGPVQPQIVSYREQLEKHIFEEDGSVKKKRVKDVANIEAFLNNIINSIL